MWASFVPSVLDAEPPARATVVVGDDEHVVVPGDELTPTQVRDFPRRLTWPWAGPADARFTVMLVDPDAPSPDDSKFRSWVHYLVVNAPHKWVSPGGPAFPSLAIG